jgi:predicted peroxiredoxin
MPTTRQRLVVKVTCGPEALERLNQGLTVAATAAASGVEVSLWLTGDATWVAVPGRAEELSLPHAAPLSELRDAVLAAGSVTVCGQCAARRDLTDVDLLPGALIRGAAAFVEEVMEPGAQALVY